MRLAAIYVSEHEYIFDKPQIINFGGKYQYSFELFGETVIVEREENKSFIDGFFDNTKLTSRLELISAIVGKNGTGKSSLLDIIRSYFIRNGYGLPYSKSLAIIEIEGNDLPVILHSDFVSVKYRYSIEELENSKNFDNPTITLESFGNEDIQSIYYSPHFDYKYNLNFDDIDDYDISFDKILEIDLQDLENKDTNSSGWNYSPTQELIFKNSIRQLNFISSTLVRDNKIFQNIFDLPKHGEAKLFFRGHIKDDPWNTPRGFRIPLEKIKQKLEQELDDWVTIRKFDSNDKVINQIDINKYLLKRRIIKDFISVLERQMEKHNSFLEEGQITIDDFSNQTKELDSLNSFLLFIQNCKIKYRKNEWAPFGYKIVKEFFGKLFRYIDEIQKKEFVEKDNIQIEPAKVEQILRLHRELLINLINYYPKIKKYESKEALIEKSNKIDGFVNYIPTSKKLSSGENALLNLFSRIHDFIINNLEENAKTLTDKKHYILLLDEADLAFHPSWKKKFVKALTSTIPYFFNDLKVLPSLQIIFTTHDPITLSDIPQKNILYLDKDEFDKSIIKESKLQSFGANIHDLLANSFFLEDGLIGEFAHEKINEVIKWINNNKDKSKRDDDFDSNLQHYKKIIEIIDERIIKVKLAEMINELEPEKDYYNSIIDREIALLNNKRKR